MIILLSLAYIVYCETVRLSLFLSAFVLLRPGSSLLELAGLGPHTSVLTLRRQNSASCHDVSISISGPGRYSGNPEYSPGTDGATEQISVEETGTCDEIHQAEQTKCGRHQEGNKTGWNVGLLLIKRQIFH